MPFRSKAQQRWMFANHPEMAAEWAKETDFSKLPENKKPEPKKENEELKEAEVPQIRHRHHCEQYGTQCVDNEDPSCPDCYCDHCVKVRNERKKAKEEAEKQGGEKCGGISPLGQRILQLIADSSERKQASFWQEEPASPVTWADVREKIIQVSRAHRAKQASVTWADVREKIIRLSRTHAEKQASVTWADVREKIIQVSRAHMEKQAVSPGMMQGFGNAVKGGWNGIKSFSKSFRQGYSNHKSLVNDVRNAKPVTRPHIDFNTPHQISSQDLSAFHKGRWTPSNYTTAGTFGNFSSIGTNKPLPVQTVQDIYKTTQSLFPVQGEQAGRHIRQARPTAVKATEDLFGKGSIGRYSPDEALVTLGSNRPSVLAHELGHSVQADSSRSLRDARGGYLRTVNGQVTGSPLATLGFEDEANDIGYRILKQTAKNSPQSVTGKDVNEGFWTAMTGADYRYLPEAMTEIGGMWNKPSTLGRLAGDKAHQLWTNTTTSGFRRSTPAFLQWLRTVSAPGLNSVYLTGRNLEQRMVDKELFAGQGKNWLPAFNQSMANRLKILREVPGSIGQAYNEHPKQMLLGTWPALVLTAYEANREANKLRDGFNLFGKGLLSDYLPSDALPQK
jgi:hypothetical protein